MRLGSQAVVQHSHYSPGGRRPLGRRCARPSASTGSCTRERRGSFISACRFPMQGLRRGSANSEPAQKKAWACRRRSYSLPAPHACMRNKAGVTPSVDGTLCYQAPRHGQPQAMDTGGRLQAVMQRSKADGRSASEHASEHQAAHHGRLPSSPAQAVRTRCRSQLAKRSFQLENFKCQPECSMISCVSVPTSTPSRV